MEPNLKENVRYIKVCTDFTMLEVKVPIIFSRHAGMDVLLSLLSLSRSYRRCSIAKGLASGKTIKPQMYRAPEITFLT